MAWAGADAGWAWGAHILPCMEELALYDATGIGTGSLPLNHRTAFQIPVNGYTCPSDVGPTLDNDSMWNRQTAAGWEAAKSNYMANNDHAFTNRDNADTSPPHNPSGLFWLHSSVRMRDILDGTSHTIMVGERRYNPDNTNASAGIWACSVDANHDNDFAFDIAGTGHALINGNVSGWDFVKGFSSYHKGGAQFVLADGSVKFISENIEHNQDDTANSTYEYLLSRLDGKVVSEF